jgi:hypothetical protein
LSRSQLAHARENVPIIRKPINLIELVDHID